MSDSNPTENESSPGATPASLVRDYYSSHALQEWRRLAKDPYHRLEFETTLFFLKKYLPACGLVLDAGGGPGRYTIALAKLGYDVILLDMTPANLELARKRIQRAGVKGRVEATVEGSIVDLSRFGDGTFDAVVCTGGPLSHVLSECDREKAIAGLVRVAKPGAPIFTSVMGRLALLVVELDYFQPEIELPLFKSIRDSGDYFGGYGFTACHFFLPEELRAAFSLQPVEILEMAGLEGISAHHPRKLNQLAKNEKRFAIWLETHFQTCTHPSVIGLCEHMLIVCRKL